MHVKVKELPSAVQAALSSVHYGRQDIAVRPAETVSAASGGGDGYRAFLVLVDTATGKTDTLRGSWGGANMFNPRNRIDLDTTERPMPVHGLVIRGSEGGGKPVYAEIECHPAHDILAKAIAAPKIALTREDKMALDILCSYKSAYREDEAGRRGLSPTQYKDAIAGLVAIGYAKANKAGAVSVTTEGRNARPTTWEEREGKSFGGAL